MVPRRTLQPAIASVTRGNLVGWLMLVLLTPTLVLGIFRGAILVSHTHDDQQVHLHLFQGAEAAKQATCTIEHAARHSHVHDDAGEEDSAHDRTSPAAGGDEFCLSLTLALPDHQPLPSVGSTAVKTVPAASAICCVFPPLDRAQYHAVRPSESAPAAAAYGPAPPRATARLVRTSHALLL